MKSEVGFDGFVNLPLPNERELRQIFGKNKSMTIFDIGSCEGEDSIRYARFFPNSKIHSFEPVPANLELIRKNVEKYGLSKRISINDLALSNKNGRSEIHLSSGKPEDAQEDWDYGNKSSSLLKPAKALEITPWLKFEKTIKVRTETLDSYCSRQSITSIDLIHMDVQGAELMVLEGGASILDNTAAIWLEVEAVELYSNQPLRDEVEAFMKKKGFSKLVDTVNEIAGDQLYINRRIITKAVHPSVYKKISVIIPTYNRSSLLDAALKSVLDQDLADFKYEILVVDDGSTDDTKSVVSKYKNVKYIPIKHSGNPAIARNEGLRQAKGDLIAFLDSDDMWLSGKIRSQLNLFDDETIHVVYSQAEFISEKGKPTGTFVVPEDQIEFGENFESLLKSNSISTSTVIARKESILKVGGFNESNQLKGVEDYDLWLRLSAAYPNGVRLSQDIGTHYRRHPGNISTSDSLTALQRIINAHQNILDLKNLSPEQASLVESQITTDHATYRQERSKIYGKPDISVVMSVYNGQDFLRPAIDSILSQTHSNFEFIIINDGSTDKTKSIIESYRDERIYTIDQKNHGLVYSLNRGCNIAAADYIARMDADDISTPSRLEKQLEVLIANPNIAVVGSFFAYIDEDSSHLGTVMAMPTKNIDLKRSLYVVNPFAHGSTVIRKSAWRDAGGYVDEYGPTEDFELWRKIADLPNSEFSILPQILYWYRINPEGISKQKEQVQNQFAQKIVDEQWEKIFIGKSGTEIYRDGRYYKTFIPHLGSRVFDVYYHQQLTIMQRLFQRNHFLTGFKHSVALLSMKPNHYRKLIVRSVAGGFLRKIGVKK